MSLSDVQDVDSPEVDCSGYAQKITVLDVETTGLSADDRVVSLALLSIDGWQLPRGSIEVTSLHAIFNPGKKSHPKAAEVHGYSDLELECQDLFEKHAKDIHSIIVNSDVLVAHNANFDRGFVTREFNNCGLPPLSVPWFCTMDACKTAGEFSRVNLDSVCARLGLQRAAAKHSALEDAWLTFQVYLWLHGYGDFVRNAPTEMLALPKNYKSPMVT